MKVSQKVKILFVAATVLVAGTAIGDRLSIPRIAGLFTVAQARIGRPLTPVSVAGVARRTVRRCAVGVYYC
jgi:branched-subunit amino acid transport protein